MRATRAAAAAPNSSIIGGAGTGAGAPPLDPVLPPELALLALDALLALLALDVLADDPLLADEAELPDDPLELQPPVEFQPPFDPQPLLLVP